MKPLNAKQIVKILKSNGFNVSRQKGSHLIFKDKNGCIVPIPIHGGDKVLPIGTFLSIVKQSKLSKNIFIKN